MSGWRKNKNLFDAIRFGLTERVAELLCSKEGEEELCDRPRALLLKGVCTGHAEVLALLLGTGMCPTYEASAEVDRVPLFVACARGSDAAVRLLLDCGAPCDPLLVRPDGTETSCLAVACEMGYEAVARLLLERGAVPGRQLGEARFTALHSAAAAGQQACIELLLSFGANPLAVAGLWGSSFTPLELAHRNIHSDAVWLLEIDIPNRIANCRAAVVCLLALRRFRASESRFLFYFPAQLMELVARQVWHSRHARDWSFFHLLIDGES